MPEVSIIIPVYKAEKVIRACIASILEQTFVDYELILIDDGSPDNCGDICEEYAAIDSRVKVIHQGNCGVSAARNTGLGVAKGKYVLFIDSDDYVSEDYISQLYSHRSDLTACGLLVQDEHGHTLYSIKHSYVFCNSRSSIDYAKLYADNVLYSPYCKLFVNRIIQSNNLRFPSNINWGEDGMFVADYLQHVNTLTVLDYVGYNYIKYEIDNSLSTKVRADVVDMIDRSRSYCIEKMMITSPACVDEVKAVCTEDLKRNITYFIQKLFDHIELSREEKVKILQKYMQNRYTTDIFSNAAIYFAGKPAYQVALSKNTASKIIWSYYCEKQKQTVLERIYQIYIKQPKVIKHICCYMKNKVSK